MKTCLLAIDQGTTGTTALLVDQSGRTLGRHTVELPQHYPQPSWVEHDPEEILRTVRSAVGEALRSAQVAGAEVAGIGITNQRETTVLWERDTGRPLRRAIVWQDRRTADVCQRLRSDGNDDWVKERSGLVLDPYFSATKIAWMLDSVAGARNRAERGEICFGTIDSFLLSALSGGPRSRHRIEVTNASRTSLMNLKTCQWDPELCALFRVPEPVLPEIVPSVGIHGLTAGFGPLPDGIPIAGIAGDQQAALFGQGCFNFGQVKCTYGTGAFLVLNTGKEPVFSDQGLLSTVAWQIGAETAYALEGSCFVAGAAVQWLRDGLGIIRGAAEIEALARSVPDSDGVAFVPALTGLGAPYWDPDARGVICGLTRRSTKAHLARATLEAIAFQVEDVWSVMRASVPSGKSPGDAARCEWPAMRVDGGAARNDLLLQMQSDYSRSAIERPSELETTARGAALLAGLGTGVFSSLQQCQSMLNSADRFEPRLSAEVREREVCRWRDAVARARSPRQPERTSGAKDG